MTLVELKEALSKSDVRYELIRQDKPILSAKDAEGIYPFEKAAPTFILQTEQGLIGCITSVQNGRLDFEKLKKQFHFNRLKMADQKKIEKQTGYTAGSIPLVGLRLPCIFDHKLLSHDYVYGGSGDVFHTLKIAPHDLLKMNEIIGTFE